MITALLLTLALQDAAVATPPAPPKPKAERKVCRPIVNTGSRMAKTRECHTAAEWKAMGGSADTQALDQLKSSAGR